MAHKKKVKMPARFRKVTYSLPESLARKLDEHDAGSKKKSRVVADALTSYFAERDRRALRAIYEEAALDPAFQEDNAAIQRDFAALDDELDDSD